MMMTSRRDRAFRASKRRAHRSSNEQVDFSKAVSESDDGSNHDENTDAESSSSESESSHSGTDSETESKPKKKKGAAKGSDVVQVYGIYSFNLVSDES